MKKILKYTGITLGVIFLLLLIAPFLFKGKIVDAVKQAANDNLNATVNFDDVSLSLIRNFPNLRLTIENLTVTNHAPFDSVQLAKIGDLIAVVDIMSVFGDEIQVRKIGIVDPSFDIRVLADGTANYDIAKEDTTAAVEEAPADTAASTFKMKLKEYYIENGNIRYEDKTMPMLMEIIALNHSGRGDFTQDLFVLPTTTSAEKINFNYDGVQYMNEAKAQIDMKLEMDMKKMKFTISENKILLNALELAANGWVEMPEEDIDMDFSFAATKTDFKNLLSMVPAAFAKDLNGVDVSGKMGLEGYVRGTYNEESLPGVGLDILVENGRFKYPDLPKSVDNIQIKTSIKADLNVMDNTTVDVSKFHLEMAQNPVDMTLKLRTPESDPDIDFNCKAFVNLDNLKEFIPLENNDEVHGQINIDAALKGRMSSVEKEQYDQFYAKGMIDIKNVLFKSDSLPYDVQVNQATFNITPAYLDMPTFDSKIGRSDLKANGKITDYLAYALRDSLLIGSFNVSSNLLDLNEFMSEEEAPASTEKPAEGGATPATEEALAPIELPGNINFNLNASFAKMIYDKTEITNVKGGIGLKDKIASLKNLSMNVLEGTVLMGGNYNAQNLELPKMDFLFDIKDMNINKAAAEFNTIDKLAPIAKSCTGKFSTKMNIKSDLGQDMMPINPTVNGKGTLSTKGVQIKDFAPLVKLAEKINLDKFKNPKLSDVNVAFKIVDGVVNVDPFTVKIDDVPAKVYGSTTLDQVIDYNVEMDIPFEKFPSNVVNKAGSFIGDLNKKLGTNVSIGNKVNVIARITGTITDPKIGVTSKALGESAVKDLKQQVVEEVKKEIKEQVTNLKNEALEKAIAEKQRLVAEAQKQADRAKAEAQQAAQQAKDAAYKLASDTEKSAKNPLEKAGKKIAADKIRKEADEAYNKAIAEANKRADKLVTDANAKGDKLIQDANAAGEKQINK